MAKVLPEELYVNEGFLRVWDENEYLNGMAPQTALVTTTMYPSGKNGEVAPDVRVRSRLALQTLESASQKGLTVYCVDGGSYDDWQEIAGGFPGVILMDEDLENIPGTHFMGKSRRQAFRAALTGDHSYFVWLEPEKRSMLECPVGNSPLARILVPLEGQDLDLVVPRRADELDSYPLQQKLEELTGNVTVMELLQEGLRNRGHPRPERQAPYLDQWIGPRAMNRDVAEMFANYTGEIDGHPHDRWESIFVPMWQAILDGKNVTGVPVDFVYPPQQRAQEEGVAAYSKKRVDQLSTLVTACQRFVDSYGN